MDVGCGNACRDGSTETVGTPRGYPVPCEYAPGDPRGHRHRLPPTSREPGGGGGLSPAPTTPSRGGRGPGRGPSPGVHGNGPGAGAGRAAPTAAGGALGPPSAPGRAGSGRTGAAGAADGAAAAPGSPAGTAGAAPGQARQQLGAYRRLQERPLRPLFPAAFEDPFGAGTSLQRCRKKRWGGSQGRGTVFLLGFFAS